VNGKAMLIPFLLLSACAEPEEALPLRALSLRTLEQTLAACAPGGSCPEEALSFGRITRILGYSLDRAGHDVLVYGLADPELPRIRTDDFLVALRSSWFRYAEGNVYQYPGCDIRPNPGLVRRLQEVGGRLYGSTGPQETEAVLRSWNETCGRPQDVSVLGIPFDTHFGQVMVKADYDMKRLADGSDAPGLPGLESVMGLERRAAQSAVRARRPVALKASMNRFWLTPGDQVYEEAEGITWIRSCPVRIRTHPIGAAAGGELSDVEGSDAAAEEFARRFSALYDEVAQQRPVYRELKSLFQVFTLTQMLRFRQAPEQVGLDLGPLLDAPATQTVPVERHVPGRHAVQRFHHEREVPGGTEVIQFWMPSCGGVEMQIEPQGEQFRQSGSDTLARLGGRLADARPNRLPVSWNVATDNEASLAMLRTLKAQDKNRPGSPLLVTIRDQGSAYQVSGDRFDLDYTGLDTEVLMSRVAERLNEQGQTRTVYLVLEGFSDEKAEVFTAECQNRLQRKTPEADVRALRNVEGTLMEKLLVSRGLQVKEIGPVTRVTQGRFEGMHRAVITFSVRVLEKLYTFTMTVLFVEEPPVLAFVEALKARLAVADSVDWNALELAEQMRLELERRHGPAARGILIEIRLEDEKEVDKSQFVELVRLRGEAPG
jgi:hypothetical protein